MAKGDNLGVPLILQWGVSANYRINDCGVACIAMLLQWKGILDGLTVDSLTHETTLVSSDTGLSCGQITALALSHGLDCRVENGMTITSIKAHLDAGRPVIPLVRYGNLRQRQDQNDVNGGHFVVINGYDDTVFFSNDPDRLTGSTWGLNVPYPQAEIDAGLAAIRDTTGALRAGVVCYGVLNVTVDHVAIVANGPLNLRVSPSTSAVVLAAMPKGATVNVLTDPPVTANGFTWNRVQYGTLVGWCASQYLSQTTAFPVGYDVYHNNDVNIPLLSQNAAFLIHKASQGLSFVDSAYASRKAAATTLWGAYHFGTAGNVEQQVDNFLRVAQADGKTVLALDLEGNPDTTEGSMTLVQAAAFAAEVHAITGIWPLLYTNANRLRVLNDGSAAARTALVTLANCPLWVADAGAEVPPGWTTWTFQQYGLTKPTGSNVSIDTDRFNGTVAALAAWWREHSPISAPAVRVMQVLPADGLNVRAAPSATSQRVGGLTKGTVIRVIDSGVSGWVKIVAGPFLGYYVSAQYLGLAATVSDASDQLAPV